MAPTMYLAQLIGPSMLLIGLGMLINQAYYRKAIPNLETPGVLLFGGLVSFVMGLAMILAHNVWTLSAAGLVTFIGWASLVKGVLLVVCPTSAQRVMKFFIGHSTMLMVDILVVLMLGGYFSYVGYFA